MRVESKVDERPYAYLPVWARLVCCLLDVDFGSAALLTLAEARRMQAQIVDLHPADWVRAIEGEEVAALVVVVADAGWDRWMIGQMMMGGPQDGARLALLSHFHTFASSCRLFLHRRRRPKRRRRRPGLRWRSGCAASPWRRGFRASRRRVDDAGLQNVYVVLSQRNGTGWRAGWAAVTEGRRSACPTAVAGAAAACARTASRFLTSQRDALKETTEYPRGQLVFASTINPELPWSS